jgi:hypothetical protein
MAITNNCLPVVDLPVWEVLNVAPAASAAGSCIEPGVDYIYLLISATSFWRYSLKYNSWQQLANPPAGTVGLGTCMVYDLSLGRVWAVLASAGTPTFAYFSESTLTWTARAVTNLAASLGTDAHMVHTDSTVHASGNDDFIYLVGNGATPFYRYSIAGNTWSVMANAVTGSVGAGGTIAWMPAWDADKLWVLRGGGTATVYQYSIGTPAWTTPVVLPTMEALTTGASHDVRNSTSIISHGINNGKFYNVVPSTLRASPLPQQLALGYLAALVGKKVAYVKTSDGVEFIYHLLSTSTSFVRCALLT